MGVEAARERGQMTSALGPLRAGSDSMGRVAIQGRVIVVGSLNIDLVARTKVLPSPGETVTGGTFSQHHGGKGGNQAVAAARLGAPTAFVGAVGDDDFGKQVRAALVAEGIDVAGLALVPAPTGVALILVDGKGENVISVASGANAVVTPDVVVAALEHLRPTAADIVLVGHEIPTAATRSALGVAGAAGATTILNPAPATGIDRSTFGLADVLTPNRGELATIAAEDARRVGRVAGSGGRPEGLGGTLLQPNSEGPGVRRAVIVTLGAAGVVVLRPGQEPVDLGAPAVAAVDTVGAGDTFNGALAAGLAAGLVLDEAVRRAVAAAALSATRVGAREGMPTTTELDRFLATG
jgi:ribokinase